MCNIFIHSQNKITMSGESFILYPSYFLLDSSFSTCLLELWWKIFTDAELNKKGKREQSGQLKMPGKMKKKEKVLKMINSFLL